MNARQHIAQIFISLDALKKIVITAKPGRFVVKHFLVLTEELLLSWLGEIEIDETEREVCKHGFSN